MHTHTRCPELPAAEPGSTVRLQGWVHRRRELAAVTFLVVRDRTGLAQVVRPGRGSPDLPPEETPVEVVGTATANPQAPGGVEVTEPTVTALADPADTPPVELWRPTLNTGAADAARPRRDDLAAPAPAGQVGAGRAPACTASAPPSTPGASPRSHSPKLVESATESGANVFEVDYFGRPAYLAQSPQFYKQVLVGVFERVYEVGPVFRAEPHDTVRHLAEYVSLDVELGFIDGPPRGDRLPARRGGRHGRGDPRARGAGGRAAGHRRTGRARGDPAAALPRRARASPAPPPTSPTSPPRTSGRSASGRGPSTAATSWSCEGYPTAHRAFYSHPDPDDPHWSRSFDLIFRGLELVSGAQRLHRYDDYVRTLEDRGYPYEPYASYVEAFRRGIPPHGGFAIGLERWVSRLTESANIREVTLFPRDLHRLAP